MDEKYGREYLENIIRGNELERQIDIATTARNYLCRSFKASKVAERKFEYFQQIKKEQETILKELIIQKKWTFSNFNEYNFLTEGGESKIYIGDKGNSVLKCNDAIYYNTWLDFLNSILLHNYFFKDTAYTLIGFTQIDTILYAVLQQPYVNATQITNLEIVKMFLESNGFLNIKRYDYYNEKFGIVIEDLHDENVLTVENKLFFIDTIFLLQ